MAVRDTDNGKINVLLVGGGAREHALAWKLKQSPRLGSFWITHPENPGLASLGRTIDLPVEYERPFRLQLFCQKQSIGLVVIGPEEPLALGLADALAALPGDTAASSGGRGGGPQGGGGGPNSGAGVPAVFGPGKEAAQLEADKAWCRQLLRTAAVPMAEGRVFTDPDDANAYLKSRESPQVVKACGLAKGKGVIVPENLDQALGAIDRIMVRREFGDAGNKVIVEERLRGKEASLLALVDGRSIYVLEPCQDHKRLGDNDTGPNTGGMGAFCPGGITDDKLIDRVQREILVPTVDALKREGIDFRGVLYCGLMLTPAGPKVLEYNVRFGDPECQALMARFDGDLVNACLATATRRLADVEINWKPAASCCVVLASRGYPDKPQTGVPIAGLEEAAAVPGVQVFHAATKRNEAGQVVTNGGRVLSVVGVGASMVEARQRAYQAADLIRFEGKQVRRDIAKAD